jgi:excisionase family DNA binding protein
MAEATYLTVRDVAALLHLDKNTIYAWLRRRDGSLPVPVKIGRQYLFPRQEVETHLERFRK